MKKLAALLTAALLVSAPAQSPVPQPVTPTALWMATYTYLVALYYGQFSSGSIHIGPKR